MMIPGVVRKYMDQPLSRIHRGAEERLREERKNVPSRHGATKRLARLHRKVQETMASGSSAG
jgi:hypothetical protein